MRRPISQQMSFGDGFIDASLYELDEELKKVDELLSNAQLLKPFEEVFDPSLGRPGTAVGIYLRMMYLKFRWGLSYEEVEREVRERLPWRYFCRLSLMDPVPDATTLIKLNQRFGQDRISGLNKHLVKQLMKSRSIKPRRIRIDSTTLEAHISYPNDVGVIHQAIKTLTRTARSLGQKITSHVRATKRALFQLESVGQGQSQRTQGEGKKDSPPSRQACQAHRWSRAAKLSNRCRTLSRIAPPSSKRSFLSKSNWLTLFSARPSKSFRDKNRYPSASCRSMTLRCGRSAREN